jgi:hypothetical protein
MQGLHTPSPGSTTCPLSILTFREHFSSGASKLIREMLIQQLADCLLPNRLFFNKGESSWEQIVHSLQEEAEIRRLVSGTPQILDRNNQKNKQKKYQRETANLREVETRVFSGITREKQKKNVRRSNRSAEAAN